MFKHTLESLFTNLRQYMIESATFFFIMFKHTLTSYLQYEDDLLSKGSVVWFFIVLFHWVRKYATLLRMRVFLSFLSQYVFMFVRLHELLCTMFIQDMKMEVQVFSFSAQYAICSVCSHSTSTNNTFLYISYSTSASSSFLMMIVSPYYWLF